MSKDRRTKKRERTENVNESVEVDNQEISNEKKKLLSEIASLKLLISQAENSLDTTTFGNVCKPQIDARERSRGHFNKLIDVELVWRNELCLYTGLSCKIMGPDFHFFFQTVEKNVCRNKYCVQLLNTEGHWRLGKWVMPSPVNVNVIFDKYPISSAESMKIFLNECKHELDCWNRRVEQCNELKAFVEGLERVSCVVEPNYGYTQILIKLVKFRRESLDEAGNILVYLWYKSGETRPWKQTIDCEGEKELSDHETKNLKGLFRKLKEQDLTIAMKEALTSEESPFVRDKTEEDDCWINTSEDEEEETSFLETLRKKSKGAKKRGKFVKTDRNRNRVTSRDDDKHENDLSDDDGDGSSLECIENESPERTENNKNKRTSKKPSSKIKANEPPKTKSKTHSEVSRKKILQLKKKNEEKAADIVGSSQKDGKGKSGKTGKGKTLVPEMFKRRNTATTEVSKVNEGVESPLQKSPSKTTGSGRKNSVNTNARIFEKIASSTPIANDNARLSTVVEENISAIGRERVRAKKIATNKINEDTSFKLDQTDLTEIHDNDASRVDKSQRVLLKDLRAVKNNVLESKKTAKRKAKSPAKGRNKKIAHK